MTGARCHDRNRRLDDFSVQMAPIGQEGRGEGLVLTVYHGEVETGGVVAVPSGDDQGLIALRGDGERRPETVDDLG